MNIEELGDLEIHGMRIEYSEHLKNRLKLRKIDYDLPKKIFEQSEEQYFDQTTGHFIAIMRSELYSKIKDVEGQKENRVKRGRWGRSDERF